MTIIRLNLSEAVVSKSAKNPEGYATYAAKGKYNLIINTKHKKVVTQAVSNTAKAKKLGMECAKAGKALDLAKSKLASAKTEAAKAKLRAQIKEYGAIAKSTGTEAKNLLRESSAALKAAGLSGLGMMIAVSHITIGDWRYTAGKIQKVKTDTFRVKAGGLNPIALKPTFGTSSSIEEKRDMESDRKKNVAARARAEKAAKKLSRSVMF